MIGSQWQLGLVVGLVAVQTLLVYRAYRLRGGDTVTALGTAGDDASSVDVEDGVVECPGCGTDNELGYRYCRSPVAELPASGGFERSEGSPFGRLTR